MEDFFEDLGNTLKKTAETVEKKTNEFIGIQKLRSRITACERKTERDFRDLGEIVFRRFVDGEAMDGEISDICDEILELQKELAGYRERLAAKRGQSICPACGAHIPKEAAFCMHCGAPIPMPEEGFEEETVHSEMAQEEPQPQEENTAEPAQETQDTQDTSESGQEEQTKE